MESSETFNSIEDWLQGKGIKISPESLSSIWKEMPRTFNVEKYLEFKLRTTKNNSLFPIDEDLIRYVKPQLIRANKQLNANRYTAALCSAVWYPT